MLFYNQWKIALFLFLISSSCYTTVEGARFDDRNFYNINDIYGISFRGANSVVEDADGFIWVSSKTGILRLTEHDLRSYGLPFKTPDAITISLVYGSSGLFAFSNNGQFFKYNTILDRFDFYLDVRDYLGDRHLHIRSALVDSENVLYIPTSSGLYSYDQDRGYVLVSGQMQDAGYVEWQDEDHFFFATAEGIHLINKHNYVTKTFPFKGLSDNSSISRMYYDREKHRLWTGTIAGTLMYLDIKRGDIRVAVNNQLPKQPVLAVEVSSDTTLLLGFDGQGLWEVNRETTEVYKVYREDADNPLSLDGNGVYDIYRASNNRVWVCTYSGGLSFFGQSDAGVMRIRHVVNNPNSLINNVINDIFQDEDGKVWFATNNGLSRWDPHTNVWHNFLKRDKEQALIILSVYGDSQGKIWAGTWSEGIYTLDRKSGRLLEHYFTPGDGSLDLGDFIFDITEDSSGDLWIAGVVERVLRYDRAYRHLVEYNEEPVYVLKELNTEEMLLGCTYGLVKLNKQTRQMERLINGYIINDILVEDRKVWCCTSGGGLLSIDLNTREEVLYSVDNGLPSNFLNSILRLGDYFWLGTENGLCRFDPASGQVTTYSSILRLSNASFNPRAAFVLQDGRLIFGTNLGAILFNPDELKPSDEQGEIFLQNIFVAGRTIRDSEVYDLVVPVDKLEKLNVDYNQTVTIEIVAKGTIGPETKISWMIEGMDEHWSEPSLNRMLTFTNLPSGTHNLKIRLFNSSLSQIIDERSLLLSVDPPFWSTWWFLTFIFVGASAIIFFSVRYHISLLEKLHSEEKISYFANMAHEIRTALTLISGPVEELRKEGSYTERGKYYLDLASSQIIGLLKLATRLLDFQKFDRKKHQLKFSKFDVVSLIFQRISMFETYAMSNDISLDFQSNIESCEAVADVDLVSQVFDNLISNAIKYSKKGGKVEIRFTAEKRQWVFRVRDYGIGISEKGQKHLFKEFYRSGNAVNSEILGSGIGLLMVRNIVERHLGKVWFESRENKGSVFVVEMPYLFDMAPETESMDPVAASDSPVEKILGNFSAEDSSIEKHSSILVVEDNDKLRNFMYAALSSEFTVRTMANGKEAWDYIKQELPDLVISDVLMPEMDGFELCRLIKSGYETSHIPVILLTALSEKSDQMHGIGLGADAYVTKPFDMTLLIRQISTIISNRNLMRERLLDPVSDEATEGPLLENDLNEQFVRRAMQVVRDNMSNPEFGKDDFASQMNVSGSLLYKKVKSLTGLSPTDLIKSARMKKAMDLLITKRYTITEVSEMCGFSSVAYFSTVFRKHYGKPPSEFLL